MPYRSVPAFFSVFFIAILFFFAVLPINHCQAADPDLATDSGLKHENEEDKEFLWAITFFNGIYTDRRMLNASIRLPGNTEPHYMHGLALSRHLRRYWSGRLALEAEGMLAHHQGRHLEGRENYQEAVAGLLLRYDNFPWNRFIDTSFAVGEGLSYTSRTPQREIQYGGKSAQLLNYLALELSFRLPRYPRYSIAYRIHHRSGVFGLFNGVKGASDFYNLGLRYHF